ncbi:MAG TPA: NAD(P)H-dependent oxidoreductase [Thermomicrobiales bacterium]|jgi:FMN-dependent NADH-azoreductase|nr:NAD(P)H-dependent oxidoreductase [Thermomicrobiales bacterium]
MTTLFRLDASLFPQVSTTRVLADRVEAGLISSTQLDGSRPEVIRRDIARDPVPAAAWAAALTSGATPPEQRSEDQRNAVELSTRLADELVSADGFVLAMPLYNWGVSQHVKGWADLVITNPRFGPRERPLAGRPGVLVMARGGSYAPGSPRADWDHATAWYERVLRDAWGMDLRTISVELTLANRNEYMAHLRDEAAAHLERAGVEADEHGAWLAERLTPVLV